MADVQLNTRSVAVKTAYEANANTNAFTDAEKTKLGGLLDGSGYTSALATKAPIANPTFTGTVSGITKSMIGLGSVDNTSDSNKPVSTATQTALNLKVSSNVTGISGADAIANMVSLTQAEYDAIVTPSTTTFYVITDA